MAFHNPFLKDGQIRFPDNGSLVRHVERWAKVRGDKVAYRFLDFSTERDGVERDLNWADFSTRNRAVGARLQHFLIGKHGGGLALFVGLPRGSHVPIGGIIPGFLVHHDAIPHG